MVIVLERTQAVTLLEKTGSISRRGLLNFARKNVGVNLLHVPLLILMILLLRVRQFQSASFGTKRKEEISNLFLVNLEQQEYKAQKSIAKIAVTKTQRVLLLNTIQ